MSVNNLDHPLSIGDVQNEILRLLERRGAGRTICPSEVARAIDADGWRAHMAVVREAARAMVASGAIEVTQRGHVLAADAIWHGAVRLRMRG
ncbi:MAG: DUF3253 domain-containing protein [Betaproteobacteria bacterium]